MRIIAKEDMRIALVNPPQQYLVDPGAYPPVGLGYLTAVLREQGYKCDLLDLQGHSVPDALEALKPYNIVGYTTVSTYYSDTLALARQNARPGVIQIAGGAHITITKQMDPVWTAVFVGAAEVSLPAFLHDLTIGTAKMLYDMPGSPLDDLPFPACDTGKRLNFNGADRTAVIFTSRGCTHHCAFCAARSVYKRIEFRSVANVIEEVGSWVEKGVRTFRFMDDGLTMSRSRSVQLFNALKPLNVKWACMVRADQVDLGLLRLMKEAGCTEVAFGIESFDPAVLKALDKECHTQRNFDAIKLSHDVGLYVHVFLMMSTPGETYRKTVDLNISHMECLKGHYNKLLYSTFMPHLGTPIQQDPAKFGVRIVDTDYSKYTQHQYIKRGGKVEEVELWSPIRIDGMTWEQQLENLTRMRDYTRELPQMGKGVFA